jgi:thiamine-phosphate pyrophosphorylase
LDGADYIGVGPVFRSTTKPRDFLPGLDFAKQVAEAIPDRPAVAIAGINAGNVDEVLATGLRAVAVSAAVLGADDVRAAAAGLKRKLLDAAAAAGNLSRDTDVRTSASVVD